MVLVGPSGSGKTTALRMVAGLEEISEGVVLIGDRVVNHVPSRDRDIAMVFQSYALYPHPERLRQHQLLHRYSKGPDRGRAHRRRV
jgi:ABC-type sugar transport system ATPase subunit